MPIQLHPTPSRIALLVAVADGQVYDVPSGDVWLDERLGSFYDPLTATCTKVTSRAREMRDAGWIERGLYRAFVPTELGLEVLASATRPNPSGGAS